MKFGMSVFSQDWCVLPLFPYTELYYQAAATIRWVPAGSLNGENA
jgi:hypothetical protein